MIRKEGKFVKIYTKDSTDYYKFKEYLKKYCVMLNIRINYHINKLIGRGSFGEVYNSIFILFV